MELTPLLTILPHFLLPSTLIDIVTCIQTNTMPRAAQLPDLPFTSLCQPNVLFHNMPTKAANKKFIQWWNNFGCATLEVFVSRNPPDNHVIWKATMIIKLSAFEGNKQEVLKFITAWNSATPLISVFRADNNVQTPHETTDFDNFNDFITHILHVLKHQKFTHDHYQIFSAGAIANTTLIEKYGNFGVTLVKPKQGKPVVLVPFDNVEKSEANENFYCMLNRQNMHSYNYRAFVTDKNHQPKVVCSQLFTSPEEFRTYIDEVRHTKNSVTSFLDNELDLIFKRASDSFVGLDMKAYTFGARFEVPSLNWWDYFSSGYRTIVVPVSAFESNCKMVDIFSERLREGKFCYRALIEKPDLYSKAFYKTTEFLKYLKHEVEPKLFIFTEDHKRIFSESAITTTGSIHGNFGVSIKNTGTDLIIIVPLSKINTKKNALIFKSMISNNINQYKYQAILDHMKPWPQIVPDEDDLPGESPVFDNFILFVTHIQSLLPGVPIDHSC